LKRRQLLFAIFKSIAVGMFASRSAFAQEELDPVKLMPDTHKVIFENSFVPVIEGHVPAGGVERKHRHPNNVLVFLADFDAEVRTFPEGNWIHLHRTFGTASWNEASVHEVKIGANAPSHTIRVEIKC
jgi:hypothetical protein